MSKFTPYPWEVVGLKAVARNRGDICKIPAPADGGVFECSANARLIKAAPEMFATLEVVLEMYADVMSQEMIVAINETLAKAKGEHRRGEKNE